MINYLVGKARVFSDSLSVQTNSGVGYKVFVTQKVLGEVSDQEIELFIYTYFRQDRLELYGFLQAADLQLFELLVSVSGCGPKMALAITAAGSERIIEAIKQANISFFTAFPRVGKKVAQKLIIELKGKLGGLKDLDLAPKSQAYQDSFEALQALGLPDEQIEKQLAQLELADLSVAEIVKKVLKNLK